MKSISLFASAGIGETYLKDTEIKVHVANELLPKRANLYRNCHPQTNMICGNISNPNIFKSVLDASSENIEFLLATPPCQGISVAGKNRTLNDMAKDERNYLIYKVIEFINKKKPNFVLIENVPMFLKLLLPYKGELLNILEILHKEFKDSYKIEAEVLDSSLHGTPQRRKRAIIKVFKKNLIWGWPTEQNKITVEEAIGYLPSLESGESSKIAWHYARKHIETHILWMKHTPTGKSAYQNPVHFPQKNDGTRIKGYESSYRRINWNEPSPSITMRNDAISSQRNVHPGRSLGNGLYSDARVLTPLELMILTSLPTDWNLPIDTKEILIRQCIGECVPPRLVESIVKCIGK